MPCAVAAPHAIKEPTPQGGGGARGCSSVVSLLGGYHNLGEEMMVSCIVELKAEIRRELIMIGCAAMLNCRQMSLWKPTSGGDD